MSAFKAHQLERIEQAEDLKFPRITARKELIPIARIRVQQAIEMTGANDLLSPVLETLNALDDLLEQDVNDLIQHRLAAGAKPRA